MLLSKVRERDLVGNKVPKNMIAAEERLELLSNATIRDAESWDWSEDKFIWKKRTPYMQLCKTYSLSRTETS